jgi:hypothetical protein
MFDSPFWNHGAFHELISYLETTVSLLSDTQRLLSTYYIRIYLLHLIFSTTLWHATFNSTFKDRHIQKEKFNIPLKLSTTSWFLWFPIPPQNSARSISFHSTETASSWPPILRVSKCEETLPWVLHWFLWKLSPISPNYHCLCNQGNREMRSIGWSLFPSLEMIWP